MSALWELADAIELDDSKKVEFLIKSGSVDVNARISRPYAPPPLVFAVQHRATAVVDVLLQANARVDEVDTQLRTACHIAAGSVGSYKCVLALIAAGATLCASDAEGRTALDLAAGMSNPLVVHALVAAGAKQSREMLARRQQPIVEPDQIEAARRDIARARVDFVRHRALELCIGLQSLRLDALQMCEILQFACGVFAPVTPFHIWLKIATTVKHFSNSDI